MSRTENLRSTTGFKVFVRLSCILFLAQLPSAVDQKNDYDHEYYDSPPVQLRRSKNYLVLENGILNVTVSNPDGMVIGISYNGIDNLLQTDYDDDSRGYWDIVWSTPQLTGNNFDKLGGTQLRVVTEGDDQVEISFSRSWDSSKRGIPPLNIDKRYIMRRGSSGFYSYSIMEHADGFPHVNVTQGRIVFKLRPDLFDYMAISDDRQRIMPTSNDRKRSLPLDYPEAVILVDPANPSLKGEVDDKYQYSSENKDSRVHGWISSQSDSRTGFWIITPSIEFKNGGPVKQDLTSHAGPIALSMFFSTHYAGLPLIMNFNDGEPWKKVFGPVFMYLNSVSSQGDRATLWEDAKSKMVEETDKWPYDFPASEDFVAAEQRATLNGRFLIRDSYLTEGLMTARSAQVGLAPPGDSGSWQTESKGYQFWTESDENGDFVMKNILPGKYNLYGWVPGIIGEYRYENPIDVQPGSNIMLNDLVYEPPRNGPTLWEIGIPDRSAAEFFIPDPNPNLTNRLYETQGDNYRQYGLWDRYTDLHPDGDLRYTIETSDYRTDWYYAHVNRNIGNKTYVPTTWKIAFNITNVNTSGNYTLRLALASTNEARLQVGIDGGNEEAASANYFTTGRIGFDNAIARHGIRGVYRLFSVDVKGSLLHDGTNTISLTQANGGNAWRGIMYDYIRLEAPPSSS